VRHAVAPVPSATQVVADGQAMAFSPFIASSCTFQLAPPSLVPTTTLSPDEDGAEPTASQVVAEVHAIPDKETTGRR
jgi:hypothetical protein